MKSLYQIIKTVTESLQLAQWYYNQFPSHLHHNFGLFELEVKEAGLIPWKTVRDTLYKTLETLSKMKLLTDERRSDLLVASLEGGSNYWCFLGKDTHKIINKYQTKPQSPISVVIHTAINAGETLPIYDAEDESEKLGEINLKSILQGEFTMLEKYPEHFANILTESDDAETADVWLQLAVMNEIVYG